jgi:hypothetical protein
MASIVLDFEMPLDADEVWRRVSDYGGADRLAPGFVTECRLEEDTRSIKFANGWQVTERLVAMDGDIRRLAYSVIDGQAKHHNAAMQIYPRIEPDGNGALVRWTTDVLPDALAPMIRGMMEKGAAAMVAAAEESEPLRRAG